MARAVWISVMALAIAGLCPSLDAQTSKRTMHASAKRRVVRGQEAQPVTRAEVRTVIQKLSAITYRVVRHQAPPKGKPAPPPSGLASRSEIVLLLDAVFEAARPEFKYTPNKLEFDAALLSIPRGDVARNKVEKLIAWGCIGRADPLATAAKPGLTLVEFGDAVGYFMSRIAELTHTPSTKYSPNLMSGG